MEKYNTHWRVEPALIRGRACVLACYVKPSRRVPTLRKRIADLTGSFSQYHFRSIDRYLNGLPESTDAYAYILESGLAVHFAGKSLFPGVELDELADEWTGVSVRAAGVTVIIMPDAEADSNRLEAQFRNWAGRGLCIGAEVPVKDLRNGETSLSSNRYKMLGSRGQLGFPTPSSAALHLDSNVLLDLEKGAQGRLPTEVYEQLCVLVRNMWFQDTRSGLAASELCWSGPGRTYRSQRSKSLLAAMDAWFDGRDPRIANPGFVRARYESNLNSASNRPDIPDIQASIWPLYCSLLKVATLLYEIDGFRSNQRVGLFREYCEFVDLEVELISSYALQVAFDAFAAQPNESAYVRKLLKFGKNILKDVWGAAWDLFYLTISDWVDAGVAPNEFGFDAWIVSADRAMTDLRRHLTYTGRLVAEGKNHRTLSAMQLNLDPRLQPKIREISSVLGGLSLSAAKRFETVPSGSYELEKCTRLIPQLEAQLQTRSAREQSAKSGFSC